MNIIDGIIVLVVMILFFFAVRFIRRNGTCTDNCSSCQSSCTKRKQETEPIHAHEPAFVQAYRKDHPKKSDETDRGQSYLESNQEQ